MNTRMKQQGFTLIELVMVIVVLGVLSAFALPRFADLGNDARTAALQGAFASVRSAASIAHAESLASGSAANANITLQGATIAMTNRYPSSSTSDDAGILAAAQISDDDFTIAGNTTTVRIRVNGATNPSTCEIAYTEAAANGTPTITINTNGC